MSLVISPTTCSLLFSKPKKASLSDLETSGDEDFVENLPQVALWVWAIHTLNRSKLLFNFRAETKAKKAKNIKGQKKEKENIEVMIKSPAKTKGQNKDV